jgi:hypothetical protein
LQCRAYNTFTLLRGISPGAIWSVYLSRTLSGAGILLLWLQAVALCSSAQDQSGELRLSVVDSSGAALQAHGILLSQANRFELAFDTSPTGEYIAKKLPLGTYRLGLEHAGFAPYSALIEIHSELPLKYSATLAVASVTQSVVVHDSGTLVDTTSVGTSYSLGAATLEEWTTAVPGRQAIEVVQSQPGWLLERSFAPSRFGVRHPVRGRRTADLEQSLASVLAVRGP